MPKRSSKRQETDPNRRAFLTVQKVIESAERQPKKNPAAVALGRLGGLKGGKARAEKLSQQKRRAIAKRAAHARWRKAKD